MVGYLTDTLWNAFVPEAVQNEVRCVDDVDKAIAVYWEFHKNPELLKGEGQQFDGILKFLQSSRAHQLQADDGVVLTLDQLNQSLEKLGFDVDHGNGLHIKEFMSEKKSHEVEVAAQVISTLCGTQKNETNGPLCVIDAGDGKGYLSSRLALEHQLHVLGIDANATNTAGAQKRTAQLEVE